MKIKIRIPNWYDEAQVQAQIKMFEAQGYKFSGYHNEDGKVYMIFEAGA